MDYINNLQFENIPAEQFEFVQDADRIHDKELQTKANHRNKSRKKLLGLYFQM